MKPVIAGLFLILSVNAAPAASSLTSAQGILLHYNSIWKLRRQEGISLTLDVSHFTREALALLDLMPARASIHYATGSILQSAHFTEQSAHASLVSINRNGVWIIGEVHEYAGHYFLPIKTARGSKLISLSGPLVDSGYLTEYLEEQRRHRATDSYNPDRISVMGFLTDRGHAVHVIRFQMCQSMEPRNRVLPTAVTGVIQAGKKHYESEFPYFFIRGPGDHEFRINSDGNTLSGLVGEEVLIRGEGTRWITTAERADIVRTDEALTQCKLLFEK